MVLQPQTEHPTVLAIPDFDALFTKDKPSVFAFHAYPWLIHRLPLQAHNHANMHVRGYKEKEGTITTAFDMTVLNELDRFHLVIDAVNRLPQTGTRGDYLRQNQDASWSSTSSTSINSARTCRKSETGSGHTSVFVLQVLRGRAYAPDIFAAVNPGRPATFASQLIGLASRGQSFRAT